MNSSHLYPFLPKVEIHTSSTEKTREYFLRKTSQAFSFPLLRYSPNFGLEICYNSRIYFLFSFTRRRNFQKSPIHVTNSQNPIITNQISVEGRNRALC